MTDPLSGPEQTPARGWPRRPRLVAGVVAGLVILALLGGSVLYLPRWLDGPFSATGSMARTHSGGTATLLADGRVLVAGGNDDDGSPMASAEVYDPATGRFSPTGPMAEARAGQTATLLGDGNVLIAGGDSTFHDSVTLATAELYNPGSGRFTSTGSMAETREGQTATLLDDGNVLIAGGVAWNGDNRDALPTAELYSPKTGGFASTGSMAGECPAGVAARLRDGRVLLVGCGSDEEASDEAELYSPATCTFSLTGPMLVPRNSPTVTLLTDGRVLVTGGYQSTGSVASAEIYDPKSGTFAATGTMTQTRAGHTATLLPNGQVLLASGWTAELYDPTSGTSHAILGGFDPLGGAITPEAGQMGPFGLFRNPMTGARSGHWAVLLPGGNVLLVGGGDGDEPIASAELFTP